MSDKPSVGFIGVGLMGKGMAKNAVEKGYPVTMVAHRKREAVDDLIQRGATEAASAKELAAKVDVIVLCVTGAPQVEEALRFDAPLHMFTRFALEDCEYDGIEFKTGDTIGIGSRIGAFPTEPPTFWSFRDKGWNSNGTCLPTIPDCQGTKRI